MDDPSAWPGMPPKNYPTTAADDPFINIPGYKPDYASAPSNPTSATAAAPMTSQSSPAAASQNNMQDTLFKVYPNTMPGMPPTQPSQNDDNDDPFYGFDGDKNAKEPQNMIDWRKAMGYDKVPTPSSSWFDPEKHPILRGLGLTLRAAGPTGIGAAIGGAAGAPEGGLGAIPGAILGAGVGALSQAIGDPLVKTINWATGSNLTPPSQEIESLADKVGLPKPANQVERFNQNVAQTMLGTAGVAGSAGKLAELLGEAGSPFVKNMLETLASNPGSQIAGSAGSTITGQTADEMLDKNANPRARAVIDTLASLGGGVAGAGLAGLSTSAIPENAKNILDLSKEYNFPLRVGDVPGTSRFLQSAENSASTFPGGAQVAANIAQQTGEGIRRALTGIAQSYRPENLPENADNVDSYLANELRNGYSMAKKASDYTYQHAGEVINSSEGVTPIQLPKTRQAAQELISNYPNVFKSLTVPSAFQSKLNDIINSVDQSQSNPMSAYSGPIRPATPLSFNDANSLRKSVGQMQSDAQRGIFSSGSTTQLGAIKKLYGSISSDISDWSQQQPQRVQDAISNANTFFKNNVLPYRQDDKIYRIAESASPTDGSPDVAAQGLFNNLFNNNQTERAPMAFDLLSEDGKKAAAYQALQNSLAKGTSDNSPTGIRVQGGLKSIDLSNPIFNTLTENTDGMGQDVNKMRGLFALARRTNDVLNNPKTGARLLSGQSLKSLGWLGAMSPWLGGGIHGAATLAGAGAGASALANVLSKNIPKEYLFMKNMNPSGIYLTPSLIGSNISDNNTNTNPSLLN